MRIEWSPLAEDAWQDIANYIFESFGVRSLLDYSELTDSWMDTLTTNPLAAPFEESLSHRSKHYHSIAIHQFSKIIYYIENGVICIADVWDTRRNPQALSAKLR